jgi:hypothetical protein
MVAELGEMLRFYRVPTSPIPRWKRWAVRLGVSGLVVGIGVGALVGLETTTKRFSLPAYRNERYHRNHPSAVRRQFKEEFGMELRGFSDDVEGDPESIADLALVLHHEAAERPFTLSHVYIRPEKVDLRYPEEQERIEKKLENGGHYRSDRDEIMLAFDFNRWTVHHEIKHDKATDVLREHSEFEDAWKKLAQDSNGNSLYLTNEEQKLYWKKNADRSSLEPKQNPLVNRRLGFVSNYARLNMQEDIAELCEAVESDPDCMAGYVLSDEKEDANIKGKLLLAAQHQLIPKEFVEYATLHPLYRQCLVGRGLISSPDVIGTYLKESEEFLEAHPASVYATQIHHRRGWIMEQSAGNLTQYREALAEYHDALQTKYKDGTFYVMALGSIADLHGRLGESDKERLYHDAEKEYYDRRTAGDMLLSVRGVNDFLQAHGELQAPK